MYVGSEYFYNTRAIPTYGNFNLNNRLKLDTNPKNLSVITPRRKWNPR